MHHVTARASGDALIFGETADRRRFAQQLRGVISDYEWRRSAYCLMGSHFHLLVYTVEATLSAGMRRLLSCYAHWFNGKYDRQGHLFVGRFGSRHITDDEHLLEAHRYIALKPLRAEHCDHPAGWRWGSYRALAGLERAPDFVDVASVHDLFGSARGYRDFVLEGRGQTPIGV